jgi:phage/plasmid-like protein (TIGR03299 family)
MAANLNINKRTGKAAMFWVGEKPWHGLGTELKSLATAKEAIKAAQLDYKVEKVPIVATVGTKVYEVPGKQATMRMDTHDVLGVVGDGYKILQNEEAFSFFDTVVGEGQAIYEVAGALGAGQRIWMLAKLPKHMVIAREDIVEKYLVLTNSHDGTSSLKVYFTPIRCVCENTLNASLKDSRDGVNIRHSGDIKSKADEARKILGISIKYYQELEELFKQLVAYKPGKAEVESYFNKVVFGEEAKEKDSAVLKNRKNDMLSLFEHGKGNDKPDVKGTMWAAYNGVTEYWDHYKQIKGEKEDPTNRLKSIWFGNAARMKERAFDEALVVAGVR